MSSATAAVPAVPPVSLAPDTAGGRRIAAAFGNAARDGRAAFIPYAVAGYPDADGSFAVALALIDGGADLVEIGLPYSDPIADGATLQRASRAALDHGATLDRSVELVARIRAARPDVPLIAMGYVNQVIGGRDGGSVLRRLGDVGVSGLILADLTPDEGADLEQAAASHGVSVIYLVTPTTTPERLRMIASRSGGFLYAVSLAGVTGARTSLPPGIARFLDTVRSVSPIPVAVGFGVSRAQHARTLAPLADGVIVASALVDSLGPDGAGIDRMSALARGLRDAMRR